MKQAEAEAWGQRVMMLCVVPSLLLHLIQRPDERARLTSAGLPDDARFISAHYDDMWRMFRVYVASESFPIVPEGQRMPELEVTFTRHEREAQEAT